MSDMDLTILKNLVRVGKVSSVNTSAGTARVYFEDKGGMISGELIVLRRTPKVQVVSAKVDNEDGKNVNVQLSVKPWMPTVGEMVVCLYLPNSGEDGFILGGV